ncbi:MAG: hypothetical protein ABSD40_16385 [Streptosporangiaceae bacterium]
MSLPTPPDTERTVRLTAPPDLRQANPQGADPQGADPQRTMKLMLPGGREGAAGGRYAPPETGQQDRYAPPETGQQDRYAPPETGQQDRYSGPETGQQDRYSGPETGQQDRYSGPETGQQDRYSGPETGQQERYAPADDATSSPLEEIFARSSAGRGGGRPGSAARRPPQQPQPAQPAQPPDSGRLGFGAIAGLVLMAFLLVVGIGIFVVRSSDLGGAASRVSATAGRSPRAVRTATPRAELAQMGAVIDLSAGARNTVVSATDEVTGCSAAPPAAIIRIREAVSRRRSAVDRLAALDVSAIPSGELMRDYLRRALRLSILADDEFIGWMQDLGQGGQCPVSTSDSSYLAGVRASDEATVVKQKFVALWNPLAARLGQPTFGPTQI